MDRTPSEIIEEFLSIIKKSHSEFKTIAKLLDNQKLLRNIWTLHMRKENIKGIGKQMVISLFRKGKITWTKFKVRNKEKMDCLPYLYLKFGIDITNPIKESSRAIYFEKEGD